MLFSRDTRKRAFYIIIQFNSYVRINKKNSIKYELYKSLIERYICIFCKPYDIC